MEKNSSEDQVLSGAVIPAPPDVSAVAEQLVVQAREQGVQLTGSDGLLTLLTRQVLETALQTELAAHLGHEYGQRPGADGGNVRNGRRVRRCVLILAMQRSVSRVTGMERLNRRSCRSIHGAWRGSTRLSYRCTRKG